MQMFLKLTKSAICLYVGCVLQAQLHFFCRTQNTSQFSFIKFPPNILGTMYENLKTFSSSRKPEQGKKRWLGWDRKSLRKSTV